MVEKPLDKEELEILRDYEEGQYESVEDLDREKQFFLDLSKDFLKKSEYREQYDEIGVKISV